MTFRNMLNRVLMQEDLNFLLTNRIPRYALTRFMGWFSKIQYPPVSAMSLATWRLFCDLDLSEAEKSDFVSLHDCFIRALRPGARPIDPAPEILVSPCDAIVGANGRINGTRLIQAKGFGYTLPELLGDDELVECFRDGTYVTLRITASMYHRFHAPYDLAVERVNYISGDTWNVNPIALRRIERLFCKNERAIIRTRLCGCGIPLALVPVAAVLVASIRLHFVDVLLHLRYRGPNVIQCKAELKKGEEMGWFEHGSTIIVFAPAGVELVSNVREGDTVRAGQGLMRMKYGRAESGSAGLQSCNRLRRALAD